MTISKEMVALMRENAALCTLEAEVILALKYNEVGDNTLAQAQIQKIYEALEVIEVVRRRNNELKVMYDGENS